MEKKDKRKEAAQKTRVAVIEWRAKSEKKWRTYCDYAGHLPSETDLVLMCKDFAERLTGSEFRYRYGTLVFDDDGSKCIIY